MKIGVVSNLYPPLVRGGAEQIAARIAGELHQRGHDVFVVSTMRRRGPRPSDARITESAIERVYRFFPPNVYYTLDDYRHPFLTRLLWQAIDLWSPVPEHVLRRIFGHEQPQVVLTHNLKGLGLSAVRAIRAAGALHLHTLHDVQLSIPSGLLMWGQEDNWLNRSWLRRWYELSTQRLFGLPAVVVSPSLWLADWYQARGFFPQSRWAVLSNPTPNLEAPALGARAAGPLRLLYVGQLEKHKGVLFLLEALGRANFDFELHVAGEGSLAELVRAFSEREPRLTYHGFVTLPNLLRLYSLCVGVVLPSLCFENSPTVIYESFLSGRPVLAARVGGVSELLREGENGFLFSPGDAASFLGTISKVMSRLLDFRARAEEIRRGVEAYNLSSYVDRLEALIDEEINPTPGKAPGYLGGFVAEESAPPTYSLQSPSYPAASCGVFTGWQ